MQELQKETDFFQRIAPKLIKFIAGQTGETTIAKYKKEADFSTNIDIEIEKIITEEIKSFFSTDSILAEEGYSETEISDGRVWIIDPICGTNNLARGIKSFCTNIALAKNKELIASLVIDYSTNSYYWSVGDGKVFIEDKLLKTSPQRHDVMIDVDFGAVVSTNDDLKAKFNKFVNKTVLETTFYLTSFNTSLGFAYVAIGKMDGVLNVINKPWDICASSFLVQHSGGIITDLEGKPWTIYSKGAILAKDRKTHNFILKTFNS